MSPHYEECKEYEQQHNKCETPWTNDRLNEINMQNFCEI